MAFLALGSFKGLLGRRAEGLIFFIAALWGFEADSLRRGAAILNIHFNCNYNTQRNICGE